MTQHAMLLGVRESQSRMRTGRGESPPGHDNPHMRDKCAQPGVGQMAGELSSDWSNECQPPEVREDTRTPVQCELTRP